MNNVWMYVIGVLTFAVYSCAVYRVAYCNGWHRASDVIFDELNKIILKKQLRDAESERAMEAMDSEGGSAP